MDTFAMGVPLWTITQLIISSLRIGISTQIPRASHLSMMMLASLSGDQEQQLPPLPSLVRKTLIHQTVTFKEQ